MNVLHWFTMSVISLVVVMIFGVVALFVLGLAGIRFIPGQFSWWALLADLVLGASAGAVTALLTGAVGGALWLVNRTARQVVSGSAPRSPSAQSSWRAPGSAVLCSDQWFHPAPIGGARICAALGMPSRSGVTRRGVFRD